MSTSDDAPYKPLFDAAYYKEMDRLCEAREIALRIVADIIIAASLSDLRKNYAKLSDHDWKNVEECVQDIVQDEVRPPDPDRVKTAYEYLQAFAEDADSKAADD